MPLVKLLSDFGLDADLIARDREMSAGFARGYERRAEKSEGEEERFLHGTAAATEFRRAGAHSILLSDRRAAAQHFLEAGQSYCRIRNPYGLLMFACADYSPRDLAGAAREFGFLEGRIADRLQLPYLLLAAAAGGWSEGLFGEYYERIGASSTSPIGLLGLPAGAYLDLANAIQSRERRRVAEALLPFLTAYNNAMRRARENEYHWRIMAMPFHPAEPDVLSVLFLVENAMRDRESGLISELLETMPLFYESAGLIRNAVAEKFGDSH